MIDDSQPALPLTESGGDAAVMPSPATVALLGDVRQLIQSARARVAQTINVELTLLHWHIGQRIARDVLGAERAEYGQQLVSTLSRQLTQEFGSGYAVSALSRMMRFAEVFPDIKIVATLSQQLSWSHFVEILPLESALHREFYAEMCRQERWSVRALREKIRGRLFERTAVADKPDEVVRRELAALRDEDRMTPDLVFRNPYVLAFLGLTDPYSERDLETAIIREIEAFLLEMGEGFTFVARQKRMVIDNEDFYLDLLLYHRKLRRLVAIELKLGKFEPAHKGQLELYLRWLDKHEREPGEEAPIGLILCEKAGPEQIALLQLDRGDIRVAEYITAHLPPDLLQRRLQQAVRQGKEQLALRDIDTSLTDTTGPPASPASAMDTAPNIEEE